MINKKVCDEEKIKKKEMGRKMRRISFALSTNQYMMVDFNF